MREPQRTHYEVLGVPTDASAMEIRRAYRARAKLTHPDAGGDREAFQRLNVAYDTLVDARRRRDYDDTLGVIRPQAGSMGTSTAPPDADGWRGRRGTFTGDVQFPSWLRDVTEAQWEPSESADTEYATSSGPTDPSAPSARGSDTVPPADVVWWWPEEATQAPVAVGPLLIVTGTDLVAAIAALDGHEAWRAHLGANVDAPPVIVGDIVVVSTADGTLHGLDVGRGITRWTAPAAPSSRAATPSRGPRPGGVAAAGGRVVAVGSDGQLVAIDPSTGKMQWSARLAGPPTVALTVVGEGAREDRGSRGSRSDRGDATVIVVSSQGVEAIDSRKGRHRWRVRLRAPIDLPPCAVDGAVWLAGGGGAGALVRLDAATGAVVGTFRAGTAIAGLTTDEQLLYATAAGPSRLLAVDAGGQLHLAVDLPNVCPEPALGPTQAYLADPSGRIVTVDRTDGAIIGTVSLPFEPLGAPTLAGERLVFLTRDRRLWATTRPDDHFAPVW